MNMAPALSIEDSRLLFVYDGEYALNNGVSSYIRTIGNYAAKQGCEVAYLVGKDSTGQPDVTSFSNTLPVQANGSRSYIPIRTPSRKVAELLDEFDPDAVHVQLPFLPTLAGQTIKGLKPEVNVIGTFHTPMPEGWLSVANRLNARLIRNELKRFDTFFSVSEAAQETAKKIYGVDSEVLPCPVETYPAIPTEQDSKAGTVITFLGRLVARKGLATLLDSVELLGPEIRNELSIQVIGDGSERVAAEERVANCVLAGKVEFLGSVSDEQKLTTLANSDFAVYPSSGGESFGIVLAEAMSVARPVVIASDIAGYSEVLSGSPSALVPSNDAHALADRIKQIISSPTQRNTLFAEQQQIVKQFDINHIGSRLMQAYGFTGGQK